MGLNEERYRLCWLDNALYPIEEWMCSVFSALLRQLEGGGYGSYPLTEIKNSARDE